jgi:hypothetical protein
MTNEMPIPAVKALLRAPRVRQAFPWLPLTAAGQSASDRRPVAVVPGRFHERSP